MRREDKKHSIDKRKIKVDEEKKKLDDELAEFSAAKRRKTDKNVERKSLEKKRKDDATKVNIKNDESLFASEC